MITQNAWVRKTNSNTVIVFVHGLMSTPSACWTNVNKSFWPTLLETDRFFDNVATFVANYQTEMSSAAYDVDQCATAVLNELRIRMPGEAVPLSFSNIIFVCHSLGGVIVRRMLEQHREYFSGKHLGLVLIASPSLGSSYPKTFAKIVKLYGHKVAADLATNSEALTDLDNRFRTLIQKNPFGSFSGAEACEHHGPLMFRFLPIRTRPIVEKESASRYFGGLTIIPGTNHVSICKPDNLNHPAHKFLQAFFHDKFLQLVRVEHPHKRQPEQTTLIPDPLFDLYSARHKSTYVERAADASLALAMRTGSAWLYGPSGTGKTTLAKRWILENGYSPVEITLSQMGSDNGNERLIQEVIQHLEAKGLNAGRGGLPGCVDALSELCRTTAVPLFVDEVPLGSSEAARTMPAAIASILDGVKRKTGAQAKIIVCSIVKPVDDLSSGKMREQFTMLPQTLWTSRELQSLVSIVLSSLKISMTENSINYLLNACEGSPRFIKIFFRRQYGKISLSDAEVSTAVRETEQIIKGHV